MSDLTSTRKAALQLVADGLVDYSLSTYSYEPQTVHRSPAFDWLDVRGYITPDYDATPVGRVLQRVPVTLTDTGRQALARPGEAA